MGLNILRRKMGIEQQMDMFLDLVSESGLIFLQGLEFYLKCQNEQFQQKIQQVTKTESQGDTLRRSLEKRIYSQTLIPESRGDVLELLEEMDALLDRFKGALWRLDIESPEIPEEFHRRFLDLAKCTVECVEAIVRSVRAFFKNLDTVSDHMHKVSYWEKESDIVSTGLQRAIFKVEYMQLCHKIQLRDIAKNVDKIADRAEDVADKLSIFVIKRKL